MIAPHFKLKVKKGPEHPLDSAAVAELCFRVQALNFKLMLMPFLQVELYC